MARKAKPLRFEDDLAACEGTMFGLIISVPIWALIVAGAVKLYKLLIG